MKSKIILVFAAVFFLAASSGAFAQSSSLSQDRTGQIELYAGYGTISVVPALVGFFGAIGGALAGADSIEGHTTGVVSGGINWYVANWFLMGVYGSWEGFSMSYENDKSIYDLNLYTAQARATFQYGPQRVKFYHAVSAGYGFLTGGEDPVQNMFIFGITPVGIKVACTDQLSIFTELGFGGNAFLSGGLNLRLK